MANIKPSFFKNLFYTYLLSEDSLSKGTIILLEGMPGNPASKEELMIKLSQQNFDVFFPRYEGTWESKGEFLSERPSKTIAEFISALKNGMSIEAKQYSAKKVFILGSSFGGGVALDLASLNVTDKICVTSPVISFREVEGIDTLDNYLSTEQKENYRYSIENWEKLLKDKLWDINNNHIINTKNILIIAGENDNQIKINDVTKFSTKAGIRLHKRKLGHISLSKLANEPLFTEVVSFLSK